MPVRDISTAQFMIGLLCVAIAAWGAVGWIDANLTRAGLYALAGSM